MRARGWIWTALVLALAAFAGLRLASGRAMETDLLAMLPETEKNPVAEKAIRTLTATTQERIVLLVRGTDPADSKAAALALARDLAQRNPKGVAVRVLGGSAADASRVQVQ